MKLEGLGTRLVHAHVFARTYRRRCATACGQGYETWHNSRIPERQVAAANESRLLPVGANSLGTRLTSSRGKPGNEANLNLRMARETSSMQYSYTYLPLCSTR